MNWKTVGIATVAVLCVIGLGGTGYGIYKIIQSLMREQESAPMAEDRARCNSNNPDVSIPGCTAILASKSAQDADRIYAHYQRGLSYERKGDFDLAIQDDTQVIQANPRESMAYNNRGFAYQRKGDLDHAIDDYNHAIQIFPEQDIAWFNRSSVYKLKGDYSHAIDDLSQVIKREPKNPIAWNDRCYYRAIAGQLDDALKREAFAAFAITGALLDGAFTDEMRTPDGGIRPHYHALVEALAKLAPRRAAAPQAVRRSLSFLTQGITFTVYGREEGTERIFPYDLLPRLIAAEEWDRIERGLTQRITALNHFLRDVYGEVQNPQRPRRSARDGLQLQALPPPDVRPRSAAQRLHRRRRHRPAAPAHRRVRGARRQLRVPSGVSYMLTNRRVMKRTFPQLFHSYGVRPIEHYPQLLLNTLRRSLPRAVPSRTSSCSLPASTTPPTLSTPTSPARWASTSSKAATSSPTTTSSTCAPPTASSASTSSIAASTTTSAIRSSSAPTRAWAAPDSSTPTAPATSPSPTPSAPAWPTTRPCTPTFPTSSSTTSAKIPS
jgi:tetratricopeptide (TPR) repeat protein